MENDEVSGEVMEAAAPVEVANSEPQEHVREAQQVPLDALQAERAERQRLQDEVREMRENLALIRANQKIEAPQDDFSKLADDDVLTVGEAKKFLGQMNQNYQMSLQEIKMTQKYPDYQATVTKYLPEVLKHNPGLRRTLEQTQDFELAYYLAKNSDVYKGENKVTKRNADAERIVQNANKAGSLSSVGQSSPISEAKRYKDMSDNDFRNLMNQNLGYY